MYTYDSYSDIGGRSNNEDSFYFGHSHNGKLLVVADGLGGHESGEVASALAIDEIKKYFLSTSVPFDLETSILIANNKIIELQKETGKKMKTTITVVWIGENVTKIANVGDSRTYAFLGNKITFQSVDHSASQMAVSIGEIEPSEIRHHADRNILTRALGASEELKVDMVEINNDNYDSLLLCSDGFWEYVLEDEMINYKITSQSASIWLNKMRKELTSRVPKNNDNNTAIVYKVGG